MTQTASSAAPRMAATEWGLLILLSLLWGGSFFCVKLAVLEWPPVTIVWLRMALAIPVLVLVARLSGVALPREPRRWLAYLPMGLLNNAIPFSLLYWAQTAIESGLASILNATTPLFTALVAHWLTRDEKLTPMKIAGIALGFAGAVTVIGWESLTRFGDDLLPQLACILGAVSYAFAGTYGRRFKGEPPLATAIGLLTSGCLILLPVALLMDRPWTLAAPSLTLIGAVLVLALVSTAAAFIIYFRILATAGATNLMLVTLLMPVSAIVMGALVLDERLSASQLWGLAIIGIGLLVIDGRAVRWALAQLPPRNHPASALD